MRKFRRLMYLKLARLLRGEKNVVPCIISKGTKVKGDIIDGDVIQIDGKIEGNIVCRELIIGVGGQVVGDVIAHGVELYGELNGSVKVENLVIAGTAKFTGDSIYKTIAIEPGAELIGKCSKNTETSDKVEKIETARKARLVA